MWLATKLGLFSIVKRSTKAYPTKGKLVHIRSRSRADLQRLHSTIRRLPLKISPSILVTQGSGYQFRILLDPKDLPEVLSALAKSVDYSSFTEEIKFSIHQRDKAGYYAKFSDAMDKIR